MNYASLIDFCKNNGIEYKENEPLAPYTTMKIGGCCDVMVCPKGEEKVAAVVNKCRSEDITFYILGRGSNVLASSEGYHGVIVHLCQIGHVDDDTIEGVEVNGDIITAEAGVNLMSVCRLALQHSLTGLEFAYGIPGSVGGALYMNAGAYGGEMKDIVKTCRYIDENGDIKTMSAEEMNLSYRHSVFSECGYIILSVTMQLKSGNKDEIKSRMDELMFRRKDKQPLEYPSCGSTFKRPEGYFAAALIEECGLKGCSIGGAQVSDKHSGFVINRNNASYEDIMQLVDYIKKTVYEKKGVQLECEMIVLRDEEK